MNDDKPKTDYMENDLLEKREQFFPGKVIRHEIADGTATFWTDNGVVFRASFLSKALVRFRYGTEGEFEDDFSYAIDPKFTPTSITLTERTTSESVILGSGTIEVEISMEGLLVSVRDASGKVLSEDEKGFHWQENTDAGGNIVMCSKLIQGGEEFYGLGDKSCSLSLRGKRFELWGSDTYAYGRDTDPLYKNIPFYLSLHHKKSYGVFFDNSFRSFFDFGHERKNVSSFFAQGGEMNYYFIYGDGQLEVAETFTKLTGRPDLPPLWALGYHQCKWSYADEATVKKITATFRELEIPCDAIYLDIDYMDGFRCFTWNEENFPDRRRMISELESQGFKTVVMIDPGIKVDDDYWVYREGKEGDHFCKRMDGPRMKGSVWPGKCCFPDFTKASVREWWAGLYKGLMLEDGVHGVWNDMNEPAVFETGTFPDDVRHHYEGQRCSHRKAHNVYGTQMVRATYEGLKKFGNGKRPFAITRSAYAGVQRFSSAWTGDNVASWEHLRIANVQCQRLAMSGLSFIGSDIGGFIDSPDGELYTRWLQMAVFHPFCRTHSSGDHGDQEPWSFGEPYTSIAREAIELRMQLLPYIYTTFWQHHKIGTPMLRSLVALSPDDPETHHREEEFGLGDQLLICPVSQPGVDGRWVYLPGGEWVDFWEDLAHDGSNEVWVRTPPNQIPVFVRTGSVLMLGPKQQYVGELATAPLTLHLYLPPTEGSVTTQSYEDAGDGDGSDLIKTFTLSRQGCRQTRFGDFEEAYESYDVVLHLADGLLKINVDGTEMPGEPANKTLIIRGVDPNFREITFD